VTQADVWVKVKSERPYRFGNWDGEYFSLDKKTVEHPYTEPAWVPKPLVDPYANSQHVVVIETYEGDGDPRDKGKSDDGSTTNSDERVIEGRPSSDNTKKEIKAWLNRRGVEYKASANKDPLLDIAQEHYDQSLEIEDSE